MIFQQLLICRMPASHWTQGPYPSCSPAVLLLDSHSSLHPYSVCVNLSMCAYSVCFRQYTCVDVCIHTQTGIGTCTLFYFYICVIPKRELAKCLWLLKPKRLLHQQTHHHNAKCLLSLFKKHNHLQAGTLSKTFIKLHHGIFIKAI